MPDRVHDWNLPPAEAVALQRELVSRIITRDAFGRVRTVAGVDVGFEDQGKTARGAVTVLDAATLQPREQVVARRPAHFPYIPGLLSFRAVPVILRALEQLSRLPDLVLCDGQGIAHPRRFGIACHLGVLTGLPTIGVAKSRLCGSHAAVPQARGEWTPLRHGDTVIGSRAAQSRRRTSPVCFARASHHPGQCCGPRDGLRDALSPARKPHGWRIG